MEVSPIIELQSKEDILQAFPVMKQLRAHLDKASYLELVTEAKAKDGYKMFALLEGKDIVAVVGFEPMTTLYYGRFIWVCDLVTDVKWRSHGYGEHLLSFVEQWAQDNDYESVALSSGLKRTEAHRFYESKMDYDKVSYVFKKTIL